MYCKTAALCRARSTPTGLPSGVITGLVKFRYGMPSIDENSSPDASGKPVSSAVLDLHGRIVLDTQPSNVGLDEAATQYFRSATDDVKAGFFSANV